LTPACHLLPPPFSILERDFILVLKSIYSTLVVSSHTPLTSLPFFSHMCQIPLPSLLLPLPPVPPFVSRAQVPGRDIPVVSSYSSVPFLSCPHTPPCPLAHVLPFPSPPPRSQLFHRFYSNKHTYIPTSVLSLLLSIYGIAHTSPHLPCSGVMNCCCVALCRKMSRLLLADVQRAAHIWCCSLNSGCSALVCAASASARSTCYFSCQCFCPVCDTFSICGCP